MLKELHCAFQQHEIKYYWDTNYNLLEKIGESEMMCMAGRLNNIIKVIEHNISDPFIIATYVCKFILLNCVKVNSTYFE